MDPLQLSRRNIFFKNTLPNKKLKGIEIGPFYRPTVLPYEADMYYADYYDTDELREQARQLNIPEESILEVHYILNEIPLHRQVGNEEFDFIIANHVLEHVIDFFRWIKDLEPSLKQNGRFLITLPDKRLSFDRFRPDTSLSHFIRDFLNGGEHSIEEHAIEAAIYYDKGYTGEKNDLTERLNKSFLEQAGTTYHPGMHVHVFQADCFLNRVLKPFLSIGWLNLRLETFAFNAQLGEFSFSLIKGDPIFDVHHEEFFKPAYDTFPVGQKSR